MFDEVFASDMSEEQIKYALQTDRIQYSKQGASKTNYPDQFFQFVSVAQAIHWFDFDDFYKEVRRITTPDAVLLVCGYEKIQVNEEVDALLDTLYSGILSEYWDPERHYIEAQYRTIPFPFTEIETPSFTWRAQWSLKQLLGYLRTWSALKKYIHIHHEDPLEKMQASFEAIWGEDKTKPIQFPIILRVGSVHR
jgi:SAM-dependent methyltransferase